MTFTVPVPLVGDELDVPCVDGGHLRYVNLDGAASTNALPAVAARVHEFLPWYSSVHRGAGYKSRVATDAYEHARAAMLRFAGRPANGDDVAIICRNTTEAINHLAYRLPLSQDDVVVTTVIEHHANLLPWARWPAAGSSNASRWDLHRRGRRGGARRRTMSEAGGHQRGVQRHRLDSPHRGHRHGRPRAGRPRLRGRRPARTPPTSPTVCRLRGVERAQMYAPFGAGALVGARSVFADGDPFLAGGGAVDLVDLDEVRGPTRPNAKKPAPPTSSVRSGSTPPSTKSNASAGRPSNTTTSTSPTGCAQLGAIAGVTILGPELDTPTLPIATFTVEGVHHALVAARLSAEYAIGVRHGCFCAHPYLMRLLHLSDEEIHAYHDAVRRGDRRLIPGAVRASATISTTDADIDRLIDAVTTIATGTPSPVTYQQDEHTGDYWPDNTTPGWTAEDRSLGASCARG